MKKSTIKSAPVAQTTCTTMIYVAKSDRIGGDSFDLLYAFDLDAAREAIADNTFHMTESERRNSEQYIEGWEIPVNAGETARDAYFRWCDDQCDYPNPDFYESFEVENQEEDDEDE